jgi:hypothetical protein
MQQAAKRAKMGIIRTGQSAHIRKVRGYNQAHSS